MENKSRSSRELAIKWWNSLSNLEKIGLCNASIITESIGEQRRYSTLTGREVEIVWKKQTSPVNMKTIFVTIKEFLENGGKLEIGRKIYREEARHFDAERFNENHFLNSSLLLGEYIGKDEKQNAYLVKNESFKSMPVTETTGYIGILVRPIYK